MPSHFLTLCLVHCTILTENKVIGTSDNTLTNVRNSSAFPFQTVILDQNPAREELSVVILIHLKLVFLLPAKLLAI